MDEEDRRSALDGELRGDSSDPIAIQCRDIRRDIRDLKTDLRRYLRGETHQPERGIFGRLETLEARVDHIEEARKEEVVNRRINATFRKAWIAGFTCLGVLSALIIGILARILSIIGGV